MSRNYSQMQKDMALKGLFSEYLPPCFHMNRTALCFAPSENCDLIAPVCFSMSRFADNGARRNIFIPEVGSYVVLQNYIRQENILQELIQFTEQHNDSVSYSPILDDQGAIVMHEQAYECISENDGSNKSNYVENVAHKLIKASGATKVLKLDIANCFSSFYMHMVPAIILGIEVAETEYAKVLQKMEQAAINPVYLKYEKLDRIIRQQNLNRTNGLLIGPLFSRVVMEALLTRIDIDLGNDDLKYSRYVDDYEVYLWNEDPDEVISKFTRVLKRYGLSLNYEKTELVDFPYYVVENLSKIFHDSSAEALKTDELMRLFNTFLKMEKTGTKGAIRYLLKSIEKEPIRTENPALYKAYLMNILANDERSLVKACSILIMNNTESPLTKQDVVIIQKLIEKHMSFGHDLEAIWLVYLLLETDNLSDSVVQMIEKGTNELAQALLLRKGKLCSDQIQTIAEKAVSWILLYELYAIDAIDESRFIQKLGLVHNLDMYKKIKHKDHHFIY